MHKYISIENNKFICDDYYLENAIKLSNGKPYSKHSKIFEYRWINYPHTFEKPERYLIKKYIKSTSIVLELGGNIGVTACLTNNITKYKFEHTVSENNLFLASMLEKNKLLNNCKFNILPYSLSKIDILDNNYIFNTLISDIEGDEYQFIIDNFEYISKHMKLLIIEFHKKYFCKNKQNVDPKLIKYSLDLLNTKYEMIDKSENTCVYQNRL